MTNAARTRGLKREVSALRRELRGLGRFGALVGRSKAMQQVYDLITRVAPTDSSVFVTGESGTGKEERPLELLPRATVAAEAGVHRTLTNHYFGGMESLVRALGW